MSSRPQINATMTNSSEGDTAMPTNTNKSTTNGINVPALRESARKRRRLDSLTTNSEIPEKTQRRDAPCNSDADTFIEKKIERIENGKDSLPLQCEKKQDQVQPVDHSQSAQISRVCGTSMGKNDAARLRKTIQWLEDGARTLREDLANVRTELHEERKASKIAKREFEAALKEARATEAAKYQQIITELKTRIARSASPPPSPSPSSSLLSSFRSDPVKDENHKRELSTLRKRLAEAENTMRRLEWQSVKSQANLARNVTDTFPCGKVRCLEAEVRSLRAENEKLDEKLRIALNAEKTRIAEIRAERENHEAELSALRKSLRGETVKMMNELRSKSREIEKLSKLLKRRKLAPVEHDKPPMRKLRENERNQPICSRSRIEKIILTDDGHTVGSCVREVESGRAINEIEVERLRELVFEQQEVIEILRQTVKERERKLEQLSNKKRKEEFYKQWLELEPVAEVDDEEDHEENDSALSSAPSSMSPQPGGCGNGVSREAYEIVLLEIEELQSKLLKEQRELSRTKIQVCDLEKALLQEKHADRDKELGELNDKLRIAEEREAALLVELSELREQNELLEFRLLELEETSARRDSPDHAMDSGIVSPEPTHANKDRSNKQKNRAVATVIPYTNNVTITTTCTKSASPVLPRKPPLTLQESGIFEEDYNDEEEEEEEAEAEVELSSRGTQTQAPSGELLQEVQRLQELRARIQERAAKTTTSVFHPIDSSKICFDVSTIDSIAQLAAYQERIRDLEERLEIHEEAEKSRAREKQLSKQREEEMLDENYRLTERIYWLENELRNVAGSRLLREANKENKSDTAVAERSDDVERNKNEILEDLRTLEDTQDRGFKDAYCTSLAQPVEMCINSCAIPECPREQLNGENTDQQMTRGVKRNVTLVSLEEKEKKDEMELREREELVVVELTESNSEKKVRRRRIKSNEREIRSAKTMKLTNRFVRDISFGRKNYPLVLYQEICV